MVKPAPLPAKIAAAIVPLLSRTTIVLFTGKSEVPVTVCAAIAPADNRLNTTAAVMNLIDINLKYSYLPLT